MKIKVSAISAVATLILTACAGGGASEPKVPVAIPTAQPIANIKLSDESSAIKTINTLSGKGGSLHEAELEVKHHGAAIPINNMSIKPLPATITTSAHIPTRLSHHIPAHLMPCVPAMKDNLYLKVANCLSVAAIPDNSPMHRQPNMTTSNSAHG